MMRKFSVIFLMMIISVHLFAGGGWPQKKGKGYFKLGQNVIIADKFYDLQGDIIDITTISLYTTSLYAEYGLNDRLTVLAYIPFFVRSTLNEQQFQPSGRVFPGDEINSFGDTDIGIKYGWTPGRKIAFATTLTLGLPLGKTAQGTTDAGDARILQTGDGEFNQMIFADASYSFHPIPLYASFGLGYNNRTEGFSDEIRYSFEVGYTLFKNFNAAFKLYANKSTNNGEPNGVAGGTVFGNNVEYISYGPELSYSIKDHFGITISAAYATGGQNLLASPNYGGGLFYLLK